MLFIEIDSGFFFFFFPPGTVTQCAVAGPEVGVHHPTLQDGLIYIKVEVVLIRNLFQTKNVGLALISWKVVVIEVILKLVLCKYLLSLFVLYTTWTIIHVLFISLFTMWPRKHASFIYIYCDRLIVC